MREEFPSTRNRTKFNQTVYDIVRQIPSGRVATYGQIGQMIPPPEGMTAEAYKAWRARWVGSAMAACPADIPWQRVVNSQGMVSARGPGSEHQHALLVSEGVAFDARGRIDLARFGWSGPDAEWLSAHHLVASPADRQERLI